MGQAIQNERFADSFELHQHYIDILNCVPDAVYWVDNNCVLKGCNHNFVQLLGLKHTHDLSGTPYEQMQKFTSWPTDRIETLKLDDMKVIFSGEEQMDVEEQFSLNETNESIWLRIRRVPLFDKDKQVIGLVVVLTDVSAYKNLQVECADKSSKTKKKNTVRKKINEPRVLMVEDNFIAQQVEEALLRALQCNVDVAESGDKALKLFGAGKYDMIFMDIGLEDTSGYLVAKKIRELEQDTNHRVPIIALTSYQADIVKNDCKDYLMDGVLTKPLTKEQAEQLIRQFVHHENVSVTGLRLFNEE